MRDGMGHSRLMGLREARAAPHVQPASNSGLSRTSDGCARRRRGSGMLRSRGAMHESAPLPQESVRISFDLQVFSGKKLMDGLRAARMARWAGSHRVEAQSEVAANARGTTIARGWGPRRIVVRLSICRVASCPRDRPDGAVVRRSWPLRPGREDRKEPSHDPASP